MTDMSSSARQANYQSTHAAHEHTDNCTDAHAHTDTHTDAQAGTHRVNKLEWNKSKVPNRNKSHEFLTFTIWIFIELKSVWSPFEKTIIKYLLKESHQN